MAAYEPLAEELKNAREDIKEQREFLGDGSKESEEYRKTRFLIYDTVKKSVDKPTETFIAEYRGFKIVVPAKMKPYKPKMRNEEGKLVESEKEEYYVYLVKNGRHRVMLGEEFGVIRRIDNVINDMRGQKAIYERVLNERIVRVDVLKEELSRKDGFADEIARLARELDALDEELGLKVS